jgi:hypothetical protein
MTYQLQLKARRSAFISFPGAGTPLLRIFRRCGLPAAASSHEEPISKFKQTRNYRDHAGDGYNFHLELTRWLFLSWNYTYSCRLQ